MTAVTPVLIHRMVQAIVDEVVPEKVLLFGSRGRGGDPDDSDVDLIVVEAEPFGPQRSATARCSGSTTPWRGSPVAADVLVYSHRDVDY